MKVIADAGPLIAFAKIGSLDLLHRIFPKVVTPPAVFAETVTAGLALEATDAESLEIQYQEGFLELCELGRPPIEIPKRLGRGEEECIQLAVELNADLLLLDDREARQTALSVLSRARGTTQLKGTLGVIVSACLEGILSLTEATGLIHIIEKRSDIWIHPALCQKVIVTLEQISGSDSDRIR